MTITCDNDVSKSAEMTFKQFLALTGYLKQFDCIEEVKKVKYFQKIKGHKNLISTEKAKIWIFNSWNTERILRVTSNMISIDENYFALQWSFPQAYYSIYCLTLAFLQLDGHNVDNHAKVALKFGEYIEQQKYPKHISFYQTGTKKNPLYVNITKYPSKNSLSFDYKNIESCQTQICQFLNGTREKLLDSKRNDKNIKSKFQTGKGNSKREKIHLNESEWEMVSKHIGITHILNLLYRKRIKSNYQNIDTFNYKDLKAKFIHNCLISITNHINLIHECYICKMIGDSNYIDLYNEFSKGKNIPFLDKRMEKITNNI